MAHGGDVGTAIEKSFGLGPVSSPAQTCQMPQITGRSYSSPLCSGDMLVENQGQLRQKNNFTSGVGITPRHAIAASVVHMAERQFATMSELFNNTFQLFVGKEIPIANDGPQSDHGHLGFVVVSQIKGAFRIPLAETENPLAGSPAIFPITGGQICQREGFRSLGEATRSPHGGIVDFSECSEINIAVGQKFRFRYVMGLRQHVVSIFRKNG